MLHIKKIKTLYGLRYAVVEDFEHIKVALDAKGNPIKEGKKVKYIKEIKQLPIDYGNGIAIFSLDEAGLNKARALQKKLNRKAKFNKKVKSA